MPNGPTSPDLPRTDLLRPPPAQRPVVAASPPISPDLPHDLLRNLPALPRERGRRGGPQSTRPHTSESTNRSTTRTVSALRVRQGARQ
jgi:hypothetical protein